MRPLDVMPRYGAAPANGDDAANGNGTPDLAQTRTHNVVNEITAITAGRW